MRTPPADCIAAAQAADKRWGVFASVSLAQWAIESAWGSKATGRFNFFGVKAGEAQPGMLCWTHEVKNGKLVACQQRFRNFDSVAEAFDAHGRLIALDGRYKLAMAHKDDVSAFVTALTPARAVDPRYQLSSVEVDFVEALGPVYATDPGYAGKALSFIKSEGFVRFDVPA